MPPPEKHDYLAWFLGPKAENAEFMESAVLEILRDYVHWRKNYFPDDPILVTRTVQRHLDEAFDDLSQHIDELLARLRRNFPFYSPRYLAHELSDTLLPSKLGYLAGMLFNPNNVTPEAAPVTTELEIEACNEILKMLGYTPPPPPLTDASEQAQRHYRAQLKHTFGWAHLCSGGTVANMEALWVARQVRYFPLAVKDVAAREKLVVHVRLPHDKGLAGTRRDIREIDNYDLLLLNPTEAIYLLKEYLKALQARGGETDGRSLAEHGWQLIHTSKYSLARGTGAAFSEYPPVILVAGTRHYSVAKAADLIGVGAANIVHCKVDEHFRLDVDDVEQHLRHIVARRRQVPLAVIASLGTTEEGAVDPVHRVLALRDRLEHEANASFWVHVDAAWGGFIRTLFIRDEEKTGDDLVAAVRADVEEEITVSPTARPRLLTWPPPEVGSAFVSIPEADSITVDPHKMGYSVYPAGCVAFRNDRVRLFILQRAPYVTSRSQDPLLHMPPWHSRVLLDGSLKQEIDSFSPFILEGSKPGAAAAGLWLSMQTIPLNAKGHGTIVRESLLAARYLHYFIERWTSLEDYSGRRLKFEFVTLTPGAPDSNLVTFVIREKNSTSLCDLNALTRRVYADFTIDAELGEREYSYRQAFFLSRTVMTEPEYPFEALKPLFERCGFSLPAIRKQYSGEGLTVLRATIMNPYLRAFRLYSKHDVTREFVAELARSAERHAG